MGKDSGGWHNDNAMLCNAFSLKTSPDLRVLVQDFILDASLPT